MSDKFTIIFISQVVAVFSIFYAGVLRGFAGLFLLFVGIMSMAFWSYCFMVKKPSARQFFKWILNK